MHPYLPHTEEDLRLMLHTIGVNTLEDLFIDIPDELRLKKRLNLDKSMSEVELRRHIGQLSTLNTTTEKTISFLGAGAYQHYVPSVIKHLASRQEFSTAYTPYQPEISQGTLQAIFEFQSMICELTGMDVSNASLYDGGTALAEAVFMANHGNNKSTILISKTVNPQYREVVKTYAKYKELTVIEVEEDQGETSMEDLKEKLTEDVSCVVVQIPNYYGVVEEGHNLSQIIKDGKTKAQFIVSVNPISLGVLEAPRNYGADTVVGEGQSLGIELQFGGPYLGFIASTKENMRRMPGRIVGETLDKQGKRAFVLTLQAREQHIRREKAMSNITSNQGLIALMATIYLSLMGKEGIKEVATQSICKAHYLAKALINKPGFSLRFEKPFFNEFVLTCSKPVRQLIENLEKQNYFAGEMIDENSLMLCVTEIHSKEVLDQFVKEVEVAFHGLQ
jgi:glycine dehydrogenase subunit 1